MSTALANPARLRWTNVTVTTRGGLVVVTTAPSIGSEGRWLSSDRRVTGFTINVKANAAELAAIVALIEARSTEIVSELNRGHFLGLARTEIDHLVHSIEEQILAKQPMQRIAVADTITADVTSFGWFCDQVMKAFRTWDAQWTSITAAYRGMRIEGRLYSISLVEGGSEFLVMTESGAVTRFPASTHSLLVSDYLTGLAKANY